MTSTTKTIIGITSGLFVLVAGYFVWRGIKNSKDAKNLKGKLGELNAKEQGMEANTTTTPTTSTTTTTTTTPQPTKPIQMYTPPTLTYPIMFGQKGDNVKKLQEMLLAFDSTILPKYGADASFGTETANALNKVLGNSIVRNEADRNVIAEKINKKQLFKLTANITNPLGIQIFRK